MSRIGPLLTEIGENGLVEIQVYMPIVVVSRSRELSQIVGGCLTKYQTIKTHGLKFPKHLKFCKTVQ